MASQIREEAVRSLLPVESDVLVCISEQGEVVSASNRAAYYDPFDPDWEEEEEGLGGFEASRQIGVTLVVKHSEGLAVEELLARFDSFRRQLGALD